MTRKAAEHAALFSGWRGRFAHIVARLLPTGINWYRGNPIVSFTFDDFPLSAAQTRGPAPEASWLCGTFYAATGLMGVSHELWPMATRDVLRSLEAEGHELACTPTAISVPGSMMLLLSRQTLPRTRWLSGPNSEAIGLRPSPTLMASGISATSGGLPSSTRFEVGPSWYQCWLHRYPVPQGL